MIPRSYPFHLTRYLPFMRMEPAFLNRSIRLSLLLLCIYVQSHCIVGQSATGFISLDCGGSNYDDPKLLGITWLNDENFVYGGNIATVDAPSTGGGSPQFTTLRYFPGYQTKYCYTLPNLTPKNHYLVRASFWVGKQSIYETKAQNQLTFKLLIDADEWASISIALPQASPVVQEIHMRAMDVKIAVCLSGKGIGLDTPFISSIELRPLNRSSMTEIEIMNSTQSAFFKEYRLDLGALSNTPVRYPDDIFDRIWDPRMSASSLSTSDSVVNDIDEQPPVVVLQTAQSADFPSNLDIALPIDAAKHFYYYGLYFSEIDGRVNRSGLRMFNVILNGLSIYDDLDMFADNGFEGVKEVYCDMSDCLKDASVSLNFSLQPLPNSTYGPLINGLEVLRLNDNVQSYGTFAGDVLAIQDIMSALGLLGWAGDPCLPYAYNWLNCSQSPFPVRINALFLSNQSFVGTIPSSINNLTELVQISLDYNNLEGDIPNLSALVNLRSLILNNNSLSGPIPNFLSNMPLLDTLLLQYNNFSGQVPEILLQRSQSSLRLDVAGNPFLCSTGCSVTVSHKKTSHWALIVGLLAAFLAIGLGAGVVYAVVRARRSKAQTPTNATARPSLQNVIGHTELVERSNQARVYSYHEIEIATDNFRTKLGEGGFGNVYHGTLRNVVVAVKVLSDDSRQGREEFLNEVSLLSQVRHKNLVRLIGYSIERKLVLVYEYMPRGALRESLNDTGILLDWRTRLRIALDAAQGLEYLHWGCNPQIIHRDVKSSNILLNDKMEAKLGDFGISKATGDTESTGTTAVKGSPGYLDPE